MERRMWNMTLGYLNSIQPHFGIVVYLFRALLLSPPNLLLVLLVIVNSPCYHSPFLLHPNPSPFLPHLPNSLLPSTLPLISPSFLRQTSVVNFIFHFFIQRKYVFIMFWIEEYNKIIFSLYFFTKQKKIHNKNIILLYFST